MSERDISSLKQTGFAVPLIRRRKSEQKISRRNRISSYKHSRRYPLLSRNKLIHVQQRVSELGPRKLLHASGLRALVRPKNRGGCQFPFLFVTADHRRNGFRQQFKLIGYRERFVTEK